MICGLGAATPVGRTALSSAAAVRAGIAGFSEHQFMVDSMGEPMCLAVCPWLEAPEIGERIAECLRVAIEEAIAPLQGGARRRGSGTTLFVNLPAPRPGLPKGLERYIRNRVEASFRDIFVRVEILQQGHAGGLVALAQALDILARDASAGCVVAGADSYNDPDVLEWLEETDQLHGAGPRNNAWGFIPGEGSGAVLVLPARSAEQMRIASMGCLRRVGTGREENLIRTGSVCLGEGLSAAFRDVFAGIPDEVRTTDVYCDMNGEPYRADEFGFAVARVRERFIAATDFFAPADCWGDVGAASGPLFLALACIAAAKGYANGAEALVWASSETGERGAAAVDFRNRG